MVIDRHFDRFTLRARSPLRGVGAALTQLVLAPPENCYPGHGDADYHRAVPIAWNLYRCVTCAAPREPERVYHRALWWITRGKYDPFGRSRQEWKPW